MSRLPAPRAVACGLAAVLACCAVSAFAAGGVVAIPEIKVSAKDAPGGTISGPGASGQDWKTATKDAIVMDGLFTLYKKKESVYAALPTGWMGKPFLLAMTYGSGIGVGGVFGGMPLGTKVLEWRRADDHVLLVETNQRVIAPDSTAFERSLELSYGNSVLASLSVTATRDSDKTVLVDVTPVLMSDFANVGDALKSGLAGRTARFDRERSSWGALKTFPDNLELDTQMTFATSDPASINLPTVPDARYITLGVHYSISRLPAVPMTPRLADDRVGYFLTAKKDFGRDRRDDYWVRYINRRRLVSSDPAARVADPVKPIVFFLDRTIPEAYRPAVKRGIENWNKAFAAAGFSHAIEAREAPDDSTFDPADARYSTIRWIVSSEPVFGAIAPSRVDPRTGEVLDADILIEGSVVQSYGNIWKRYVTAASLGEAVMPQAAVADQPLEVQCAAAEAFADGGLLLRLDLLASGALTPGAPMPREFLDQALTQLVMHEVGHTLGLRHNFRSSTATPFVRLADTTWTRAHGVTGSVMDYVPVNVGPDSAHQGDFYTQTVGDYDVWAIRYGYTPSGTKDLDADYAAVRPIAEASLEPGHEYSTDEDTYPWTAPDPRSNLFDLGDDPLRYADTRLSLVQRMWQGDVLESRLVEPGAPLTALRRTMDALLAQSATVLGLAVKNVGGEYVTRVHRGQAGYVDPVRLVPAARQRAALDFLARRAFAANAFAVSPALLAKLAPEPYAHWGLGSAFGGGRVEYDWNDRVAAIQSDLVDALLAPPLLARLHESESRAPASMTLAEHFARMTAMLWGEVGGTLAQAPAFAALEKATPRRETQLAYIDRLAGYMVAGSMAMPEDARSLARLQLQRIDARCARALSRGTATMGDYTQAHLLEARARIHRALTAQRTIGGGGGFFTVLGGQTAPAAGEKR